tara:strand:+ start:1969 stop:2118 length:150 start_codon:yes stop_codon:yes gene_type:complete
LASIEKSFLLALGVDWIQADLDDALFTPFGLDFQQADPSHLREWFLAGR